MRISRLEREAQAARVIYETFLSRLQETREQANLQTPDASFLTRASIPSSADARSRLFVAGVGGAAGIAAGIALVFLLERLNNTFRNPDAIRTATGVPVLASIPVAGRRKPPRRLIRQALRVPNSAFAESVRNLRTSLLFSDIENPPRAIMFASSLPGEGKTATALLMAVLSRQMGRSTVIVDCDLRRRTLAREFAGAEMGRGLAAVLEGKVPLDQAIWADFESGVHVLALEAEGEAPRNPADLLSSDRFSSVVDELKSRYDLVVFDTPPVLAVTDARLVAQAADAIVYLVAWNRTPQSAVSHGLRELASVNTRIAGMALTLVSDAQAARYMKNNFYYKRRYRDYVSS
jgi:capsular exopolysaccharide synthesis family protein